MESRNDVLKKLQGVISKTPSQWNQDVLLRSENKPWKKRSQAVALKVLRTLRAKGISQKDLAEQIGVSAQQVNKWVKGNENFTFETISKLETALGVELMSIKGYQSQKQHIQSKLVVIDYIKSWYHIDLPMKKSPIMAKIIQLNESTQYPPKVQYAQL
jgi:transcriptional regulator with XRE-family HTH domain